MESLGLVDLQKAVNSQKRQLQLDSFKLHGLLLWFLPLDWTFSTLCWTAIWTSAVICTWIDAASVSVLLWV